jgi:hypothetical protein
MAFTFVLKLLFQASSAGAYTNWKTAFVLHCTHWSAYTVERNSPANKLFAICAGFLQVETTTAIGIKKTHVQYVIRVDSSIPGMVAHGTEVRRRFSDFDVSIAFGVLWF